MSVLEMCEQPEKYSKDELDVHFVPEDEQRSYHVFLTAGLSADENFQQQLEN